MCFFGVEGFLLQRRKIIRVYMSSKSSGKVFGVDVVDHQDVGHVILIILSVLVSLFRQNLFLKTSVLLSRLHIYTSKREQRTKK